MKFPNSVPMGEAEYDLAKSVAVSAIRKPFQQQDLEDATQVALLGIAEAICREEERAWTGPMAPRKAFLIVCAKRSVWNHTGIQHNRALPLINPDDLKSWSENESLTVWNSEMVGDRSSGLWDKRFDELIDGAIECDETLLRLMFIEGCSAKRLARETGISEIAVRRRRDEAVAHVRELLASRFPDEFPEETKAEDVIPKCAICGSKKDFEADCECDKARREFDQLPRHGSNNRYTHRKYPCHCDACSKAHADYARSFRSSKKPVFTVSK